MEHGTKRVAGIVIAVLVIAAFAAILAKMTEDPLKKTLSNMTLRDKAAQMMIASFRVWKEVPETEGTEQAAEEQPAVNITELNDEIRDMVKRNHFGGILLYGENFQDAEQTLRLVSQLQTANQSGGGLPQLFFVDQEGGNVNRLGFGTIGVSNMALAATGHPANARSMSTGRRSACSG